MSEIVSFNTGDGRIQCAFNRVFTEGKSKRLCDDAAWMCESEGRNKKGDEKKKKSKDDDGEATHCVQFG